MCLVVGSGDGGCLGSSHEAPGRLAVTNESQKYNRRGERAQGVQRSPPLPHTAGRGEAAAELSTLG